MEQFTMEGRRVCLVCRRNKSIAYPAAVGAMC